MFLDERLLERCKQTDIRDGFEETALLTRDLFSMCDEYYKKQFKEAKATTGKEMKVILDRTFNFFDLFVRNALKSEDENLHICGKIFQEYSYKTAFLEDPKIREIYERIQNDKNKKRTMKNLEEYYKDNLKGIKVGDKVFDLAYGHGVVYAMRRKNPPYYYRIKVKFDVGRLNEYTKNGCVHTCYPIPILFFDKPTYDKDGYPIPQQKEENWKNILTK